MATKIVYVISDIIQIISTFLLLNAFFHATLNRKKYVICLLAYMVIDCAIYFFNTITILFTISTIITFFGVTLFYSKPTKRSIIATVILTLLSGVSEMLSTGVLALFNNILFSLDNNTSLAVCLLIARLLFFIFAEIIIIVYQKKKIVTVRSSYIIFVLPVVSIFIMYLSAYASIALYDTFTTKSNILLILPSVLLIAVNILVFYNYERSQKIFELEQRNLALRDTISAQQNEFRLGQKLRQDFNREKHDYKNMLAGIQAELHLANYDRIDKIISEHIGSFTNTNVCNSGQLAIDSIINIKAEKALELGLSFDVNTSITQDIATPAEELCILLGVGLDNAIEYLTLHPDLSRTISISISSAQGLFRAEFTNEVAENITIIDGKIPTTKSEPGHGLGIDSARLIAKKHEALIVLECEDNIFHYGVSMMI